MDEFTMTEEAYKKGYRDGLYAGKMGTGDSSAWGSGPSLRRPCLSCGFRGEPTRFCPDCGKAMANPWPFSEN